MMRFNQKISLLLPLLCLTLLAALFAVQPGARGQGGRVKGVMPQQPTSTTGLQFRLSEGAEAQDRPQRLPTPLAQPLDKNATDALLNRLAPLKAEPNDEQDFALRERSLPPPRAGQTVNEAFPPAGSAACSSGRSCPTSWCGQAWCRSCPTCRVCASKPCTPPISPRLTGWPR